MKTFEHLNLSNPLLNAIDDLGFETPTPIQIQAFPAILSGNDLVGISQTGTGKTLAYMLPILQDLKYSDQVFPRVLILVPTRELVLQMMEMIKSLTTYKNVRVLGIYGGTNINTQKKAVVAGCDILVATPGRLYDLALTRVLKLNNIKKLVIDEVDVMLDLGFRFQLTNIFEIMKERRQNIMFSATMTEEIDALIDDFFTLPKKISIEVSGTPLDNIKQSCYAVKNFHTKINLLKHIVKNKEKYAKVLVFAPDKKSADIIYEAMEIEYGSQVSVIHSNKSQNYRFRSIEEFEEGQTRILISTDVMARGLDLEMITHVINFNTPTYAENYMHRIGRTGRAKKAGKAILFYTEKEEKAKAAIERLMDYEIPEKAIPSAVVISNELTSAERPKMQELNLAPKAVINPANAAFHEKKEKNKKTNQGGSYLFKKKKYKKAKTRGDKNMNNKNKKR
ncbi:MAG: DEAD/DEAH box helicase [Bacteroidetes bacterium 4572_77]|nr:MAG: DEAD/DEAH box helicase [Bacteroidetes bacterium 4572_77]